MSRATAAEFLGEFLCVVAKLEPDSPTRCGGELRRAMTRHAGDPKDVILAADESYRAERDEPMHLSALQPCVVEIEFEDEVMAH